MTLTQAIFIALLGSISVLSSAHADQYPDISLHNDGTLDETTSVRNWTLLCEHLCRLNLSGPACGLDCASAPASPVSNQQESSENNDKYNLPIEDQSEVCESLCDVGLGGSRCNCPVTIVAASSKLRDEDRMKICYDFCRFYAVTLRGCKKCPFAQKNVKPPKEFVGFFPSSSSTTTTTSTQASPIQLDSFDFRLNSLQFDNPVDAMNQPSTATPTTPDWNRLCATLCRQGNGGILCNCDLAPF